MKKIDYLLLKAYWLPFLAGLAIILFILVNQYLYWFLQAFAGKGLSMLYLGKLFVYAAGRLIILALPIAIMVGALITFGNLSEHNELMAIKSSGIGFFRLVRPFAVLGLGLTSIALMQTYFLIPQSSTNLYTLLFDINRKKADMALSPGQFYTDIEGYVIRVAGKSEDGAYFRDVLIYKQKPGEEKQYTIRADFAKLTHHRYRDRMKMVLFDGVQIEDYLYDDQRVKEDQQMGRMYFDSLYAYFPMEGFELESTSPSAFRHQYMMSQPILASTIDSLKQKILENEQQPKKQKGWEQREKRLVELMLPFQFEFYRRTALPANCVVFMLIGCALGIYIKKGDMGVAAIAGLIAFTLFYVIDSQGKTLTVHQVISPFWGAWASVFILGVIAIILAIIANKE